MITKIAKPPFYIWHGEGCCDNVTDDLEEARQIERELLEDHEEVYIVDSKGIIVGETYEQGEA